jgi:glutamate/tyrosine decarboxylase-like PLP-dependent enzyme
MIQPALHSATAVHTSAAVMGYVLVPPPDYVLIPVTGAIIVLAGILIAAYFAGRIKHSVTAQSRDILGSAAWLAEQIEQLGAAVSVTDARVAALAARLDEHSRTTQGSGSTSYNVAIRMARSGASRQELMSTCGVTQQEADLILRLHAADPGIRSAA